jgi:hypothetical protein
MTTNWIKKIAADIILIGHKPRSKRGLWSYTIYQYH